MKISFQFCTQLSISSYPIQQELRKDHPVTNTGLINSVLDDSGATETQEGDRLVKGLSNTLSTCFMNVVLQNLLAMDVLRNYFLQPVNDLDGPLTVYLRKLFLETSVEAAAAGTTTTRGVMDATPIFYTMCNRFPYTYRPYRGQNPAIFLKDLVDILSNEEILSSRGKAPLLKTMFGIQLKEIICTVLDIPAGGPRVSVTTIESCLEEYMIRWNNYHHIKPLFCFPPRRDARRINVITKAFPIITIHFRDWYFCKVKFKETLDFEPYMDPKYINKDETYIYGLVGLGEVRSNPMHVITYVKCSTRDTGHCFWYHIDDAKVTRVSMERVLSCKAAILFYERCQGSK